MAQATYPGSVRAVPVNPYLVLLRVEFTLLYRVTPICTKLVIPTVLSKNERAMQKKIKLFSKHRFGLSPLLLVTISTRNGWKRWFMLFLPING
jgi:hypothetical protein